MDSSLTTHDPPDFPLPWREGLRLVMMHFVRQMLRIDNFPLFTLESNSWLTKEVSMNKKRRDTLAQNYTLQGLVVQNNSQATAQRRGMIVISRRAAMRSASGGCVLKRPLTIPLPNRGFTMHSAEVVGETAVEGICWL
jgi:hypothetical protein